MKKRLRNQIIYQKMTPMNSQMKVMLKELWKKWNKKVNKIKDQKKITKKLKLGKKEIKTYKIK